jgi:hypothetical protein
MVSAGNNNNNNNNNNNAITMYAMHAAVQHNIVLRFPNNSNLIRPRSRPDTTRDVHELCAQQRKNIHVIYASRWFRRV